jgi:hypothetical protein
MQLQCLSLGKLMYYVITKFNAKCRHYLHVTSLVGFVSNSLAACTIFHHSDVLSLSEVQILSLKALLLRDGATWETLGR